MSENGVIVLTAMVSKTATAKNGKPYVVLTGNRGGNFCVFPKNGHDAATTMVKSVIAGTRFTFKNVGFANGSAYVYDDSEIELAA